MERKIAVCFTTHNRPQMFNRCLISWQQFLPPDARIFIVDDASDTIYCEADYRFEENVGVAVAKNKCIELAYDWGADYIFLVDDDVICKSGEWYRPYIESGEDHLQHIYGKNGKWKDPKLKEVGRVDNLVGYADTKGVMLYLTRKCVDTIGGFYRFGRFGGEHRDYSMRAHKAGLSTFLYGDIKDSTKYFCAYDNRTPHRSSLPPDVRKQRIAETREMFKLREDSARYVPFK